MRRFLRTTLFYKLSNLRTSSITPFRNPRLGIQTKTDFTNFAIYELHLWSHQVFIYVKQNGFTTFFWKFNRRKFYFQTYDTRNQNEILRVHFLIVSSQLLLLILKINKNLKIIPRTKARYQTLCKLTTIMRGVTTSDNHNERSYNKWQP